MATQDTKDTRRVSKPFSKVATGDVFWRHEGVDFTGDTVTQQYTRHVKVDHKTSRDMVTQEECDWTQDATVMVEAQCHRKLVKGERVRVTRRTTRRINSSESAVTGTETFEGAVADVDEHGAFVEGDDGEMVTCSQYAGDEHGHPVTFVEVLSEETVATRLQTWNAQEPVALAPDRYDALYPTHREDEIENRERHLMRIARIVKGLKALGERGVFTSARLLPRAIRRYTGDVWAHYAGDDEPCMVSLTGVESLMDTYDIDPHVDQDSIIPKGELIA